MWNGYFPHIILNTVWGQNSFSPLVAPYTTTTILPLSGNYVINLWPQPIQCLNPSFTYILKMTKLFNAKFIIHKHVSYAPVTPWRFSWRCLPFAKIGKNNWNGIKRHEEPSNIFKKFFSRFLDAIHKLFLTHSHQVQTPSGTIGDDNQMAFTVIHQYTSFRSNHEEPRGGERNWTISFP